MYIIISRNKTGNNAPLRSVDTPSEYGSYQDAKLMASKWATEDTSREFFIMKAVEKVTAVVDIQSQALE